jgi:hypothetical protein
MLRSCATLALLSLVSAGPTTSPTTARVEGRTDHDLLREIAAFDQQFIVDAYEKHGHHDLKWDDVATKLIRAQYEASIHPGVLGRYYAQPADWPKAMPIGDRVKLASALLDTDCDDAIALYMVAKVLDDSGRPRAGEAFTRADQNAAASPYVPILKLAMLDGVIRYRDKANDEAELPKLRERVGELLGEVLTDKETLPRFRTVVWQKGWAVFQDSVYEETDRSPTAIPEVKDPDPWLWEMCMGRWEIVAACKARGGGYAPTVTREGWKSFGERLALAREHLERANDIDKTLPHAAALLITIAVGQSSSDAEKWFREATARQIDSGTAYKRYRWVVQPRWGGSVPAQLAFAKRVVTTGRFETRVPAIALDIIGDIEDDTERPSTPDELEQYLPIINDAMAGYATPDQREPVRAWANSIRIAWLAQAGHWDEARALLDVTPKLDKTAVEYRGFEIAELAGQILAMTGPAADAIAEAMETPAAADRLRQIDAIAPTLAADEKAAVTNDPKRAIAASEWLARRRSETAFEVSLAAGEWTPLPIAPDLKDWRLGNGEWKADGDNAIVGTSKNGLMAIAPFQMPERYEFRCRVELIGEVTTQTRGTYVLPAWSPLHQTGAWISLIGNQSYLLHDHYRYDDFPIEREGNATTVRFRYDRGTFIALDEAGNRLATSKHAQEAIRRPAFGGTTAGTGVTLRFSDIEVRALE